MSSVVRSGCWKKNGVVRNDNLFVCRDTPSCFRIVQQRRGDPGAHLSRLPPAGAAVKSRGLRIIGGGAAMSDKKDETGEIFCESHVLEDECSESRPVRQWNTCVFSDRIRKGIIKDWSHFF